MKTTTHYKGHRWSTNELRLLMKLWSEDYSIEEIAKRLKATTNAVSKQVVRMRQMGIPLVRRTRGHIDGMTNKAWSHADVQYLLRRRIDNATSEQIGLELGRSHHAVAGMIQKLRKEHIPVAMRGCGVRRLWDANQLKAFAVQSPECKIIEKDKCKTA